VGSSSRALALQAQSPEFKPQSHKKKKKKKKKINDYKPNIRFEGKRICGIVQYVP
jgi:hypothetical protein